MSVGGYCKDFIANTRNVTYWLWLTLLLSIYTIVCCRFDLFPPNSSSNAVCCHTHTHTHIFCLDWLVALTRSWNVKFKHKSNRLQSLLDASYLKPDFLSSIQTRWRDFWGHCRWTCPPRRQHLLRQHLPTTSAAAVEVLFILKVWCHVQSRAKVWFQKWGGRGTMKSDPLQQKVYRSNTNVIFLVYLHLHNLANNKVVLNWLSCFQW